MLISRTARPIFMGLLLEFTGDCGATYRLIFNPEFPRIRYLRGITAFTAREYYFISTFIPTYRPDRNEITKHFSIKFWKKIHIEKSRRETDSPSKSSYL